MSDKSNTLRGLHAQRGQSLPMTAIGLIALIAFGFFALDYANTVRWQIRAQSAADSAAQAVMSIQTQEFNEMTATLYAAAVEEYRIRHNLNAMAMAANLQGGCAEGNPTYPAASAALASASCAEFYRQLQPYFMRAVARYSSDVQMLSKVTANLSLTNIKADANTLITQLNEGCLNGSKFNGDTDCVFNYTIPANGGIVTRATQPIYMNAVKIQKPENGSLTGVDSGVNTKNGLAPVEIEVETCAKVPPVIPSFFGYQPNSNVVIGRAAATAVMVEQDWLQPGTITNPVTRALFQPNETYITDQSASYTDSTNAGYDWYDLSFGGNGQSVNAAGTGFKSYATAEDEFSVWTGWWNSIPIHTFVTTLETAASFGCPS